MSNKAICRLTAEGGDVQTVRSAADRFGLHDFIEIAEGGEVQGFLEVGPRTRVHVPL